MQRPTLFIFILCQILGTFSWSQVAPMTYLDSLVIALDTMPADTNRVHQLNEIGTSYRNKDLDLAATYTQQALELARQLNFQDGEQWALFNLGVVYRRQGKMEEAIQANEASYAIAEANGDDYFMGANGNALGNTYMDLGENEKAVEVFLKALENYERADYDFGRGLVANNLGLVFKTQRQLKQSQPYFENAVAIFSSIPEERVKPALAMAYMNLGNVETNDSLAIVHLQTSFRISQERGNKFGMASASISTGAKYMEFEEWNKALPYYQEALTLAEEVGSSGRMATAKSSIGKIYYELNNFAEALQYSEEALQICLEREFVEEEMETRRNLADIYAALGRHGEANEELLQHLSLKDTLFSEDRVRITNELEAKYQASKKEAELAEQALQIIAAKNQRNRILLIAAGILILGLLLTQWFIHQQRKRREETQLALALQQQETEQLKEINRMKTTFFTNISHELRTPLTLILSPLADILENRQSSFLRDKLTIIQANAQRLLNLVNEIMDLSKVEAGKLSMQESRVTLIPLLKRIFASYESAAELRRLDFTAELDIPPGDVQLDREKFEKILHNLLVNALKYTNAGGQVQLIARRAEGHYLFAVRDTGSGIHPEDQTRIFDRFYQAKHANQQQGGTGVGLALAKELAQLLGGDLSLQSTLGKGSTFNLRLPLKELAPQDKPAIQFDKEKSQTDAHVNYTPLTIQGNKPRILVVEDNPDLGKYLVDLLSSRYQCTLATDGIQALHQLEAQSFDCITSDVMMPNMDGFTLREQINKKDSWRQIPFLLLTARHLEDDKVRGFQLGIDDYITKPFRTRELHARIHNLIQNKLEREASQSEEQQLPQEEQLSADEAWLRQLEETILANLDNPQFNVEELGKAMHYSSKQLGRIIRKHTGLSTVNLILEIRLQKARELFEKRMVSSVTEAQLEVGISSMSYFTRKFTERFGKNPKEML